MNKSVYIGAVCFGLDPTVVSVRRSRLTYGVGVVNRFIRGQHPESKLINRDDADWCSDVFDRFVAIDQPVSLGDTVLRRYTPANREQKIIVMHIYCSESNDVQFVTDAGVQRCGTIKLDLASIMAQAESTTSDTEITAATGKETSTAAAHRREIQTWMTFGDTEIKVTALDVDSGYFVRSAIDFLNK